MSSDLSRNELQNIHPNEISPTTEVVINVLARERNLETLYKVLNEFAPNREDQPLDSYEHPKDKSITFSSEREMIGAFVNDQTRYEYLSYWHEKKAENNLYVGAHLTTDGYMVIVLTHYADGKTEHEYLSRLKELLCSDYGTFKYGGLPEFVSGEEFKSKYPPMDQSKYDDVTSIISSNQNSIDSTDLLSDENTLLIPSKLDIERDAVANSWKNEIGMVKRVDKFWVRPKIETHEIAIYGNDTFALVLAQVMNVKLISPIDETLATLEKQWIKRSIQLHSIVQIDDLIYPSFIKPVTPKLFQSRVYESLSSIQGQVKGVEEHEQILVSTPIRIECEIRSFILNQKVMDLAIYKGKGDLESARVFIQNFLKDEKHHSLPVTYVLDVGYNSEDGWFIIEFNSTWGAGLNGCSPNKVIHCIKAATINLP